MPCPRFCEDSNRGHTPTHHLRPVPHLKIDPTSRRTKSAIEEAKSSRQTGSVACCRRCTRHPHQVLVFAKWHQLELRSAVSPALINSSLEHAHRQTYLRTLHALSNNVAPSAQIDCSQGNATSPGECRLTIPGHIGPPSLCISGSARTTTDSGSETSEGGRCYIKIPAFQPLTFSPFPAQQCNQDGTPSRAASYHTYRCSHIG